MEPVARDASGLRQFSFVAGAMCLDFANTVGGLRGLRTQEHLQTFPDLLAWGVGVGALSSTAQEILTRSARVRQEEAEAVRVRALRLREAIYALFTSILGGAQPAQSDIEVLNEELAHAFAHLTLACTEDGFVWRRKGAETALDSMLWPVARSASDLLVSDTAALVRQCSSDTCGWLFIDSTKNHSRRWCDMRGCGNRAKARRHRDLASERMQ
jgi:predicted RNA-binding Zn ribbon-like protein